VYAQPTQESCDFFEEENGLLVVELESLPLTGSWEVAHHIDGYTGNGYIQWTGNQFFNQTGNGAITFQIKINTPGTYSFNWRVAVGNGEDGTLHNDTWLKINGDNFYAKQGGVHTTSRLKPKPQCNNDPTYGCPNGSSSNGFFKVFGGQVGTFQWKAKTSDHDAHDIAARFDTVGVYSIEINARSSFQAIDRLILWHTTAQRSVDAQKLFNPESTCLTNIPTSTHDHASHMDFQVFPNPAQDHFWVELGDPSPKEITLMNYLGQPIQIYQTSQSRQLIQIGSLEAGVYLVEVQMGQNRGIRRVMVQ
jgi:hypothetical protein